MGKSSYFLILPLLLFHSISFSQKKVLNAVASGNITVDGKFDEPIWEFAPVAKDFIMFGPDNGKPVDTRKKTEVQIAYNDDAIYIAAKMYDDEPAKILREITQRDNFGTADHFGVFLNGLNDSQQDFRFFVSAAGVQMDCLFTNKDGEDFTWDAIWDSKVAMTDYGWAVEIKIPYAALRFSKTEKQTWGLNFYRELRRNRQTYTWNLIDSKISNESAQSGILEGIDNIETPTRLFLIPYSSVYVNANQAEKTKGDIKGGLDIKYGISDAFTLDAILVPDFGQTKFDNVELYLGPFEQQFTENRPFFTEGTDLFRKGNLFYSRRIGQNRSSVSLNTTETVADLPNSIKLINALKISGRTKSGLGIGVLNAITERTTVKITDSQNNLERTALLQPLTNYNVLVLDQRFRKNSSLSFVNTNMTRDGEAQDANVSALVFDLNTKANTYNINGDFKYSYLNQFGTADNKKGFNTSLNFAETSGKFRYGFGGKYVSKDFDNDDLGILFQTHFHSVSGNVNYRILNPNKTFNTFTVNLDTYSEFENKTGKIQACSANLSFNTSSLKNDFLGFGLSSSPLKTYDFYEPRSSNDLKAVIVPQSLRNWIYYSTNYNRPFAFDIYPQYIFFNEKERVNYGLSIIPRYRFNDHLSIVYDFTYFRQNNNLGSARDELDPDVFTQRDIISYSNTLQGKLAINNKMNFNLSLRHYWAYVNNHQFLTLQKDGSVLKNSTYYKNIDSNFNSWNFDLSYNWWFAPGSQISILYRNNSSEFENTFSRNFDSNFSKAIDNQNLNHIFSISLRYFIDYNDLKR